LRGQTASVCTACPTQRCRTAVSRCHQRRRQIRLERIRLLASVTDGLHCGWLCT